MRKVKKHADLKPAWYSFHVIRFLRFRWAMTENPGTIRYQNNDFKTFNR
ncbi:MULTISPECIES: hypothetical protein [Bacteroidaceae]|nr:hypothetical protein [Phocaeicola vulgatus]